MLLKSAWTYLCLSRCSSVENICVIHYPILVPPAAQPNAPDYLTLYNWLQLFFFLLLVLMMLLKKKSTYLCLLRWVPSKTSTILYAIKFWSSMSPRVRTTTCRAAQLLSKPASPAKNPNTPFPNKVSKIAFVIYFSAHLFCYCPSKSLLLQLKPFQIFSLQSTN